MTKEEYKNGNKVINAEIEALYVKFDANPNKKTAKLISLKIKRALKLKTIFIGRLKVKRIRESVTGNCLRL